jgi:hypothetical protein
MKGLSVVVVFSLAGSAFGSVEVPSSVPISAAQPQAKLASSADAAPISINLDFI